MKKTAFKTTSFSPNQFTSAWFYLTDEKGLPCDGQVEIEDNAVVCSSTHDKFSLNILVEVSGFGKVMCRTALVSTTQASHDLLSSLIEGRVAQIETEFKKEKISNGTLFESFIALKTAAPSLEVLNDLMHLGERLIWEQAQHHLEERISRGETKDFLIGGQAFGIEKDPAYKKIHQEHFDLGIAPLYFFLLKPESRDKTNWELTDKIVDWLVKTNRPIKGHPLVWLHKYARPEWMLSLSFDELKVFLREHITEVIHRYGDRIKMWDIVNEIPSADANGFDLTMDQLLELTKMISDLVKELQPEAERIINFSEIFGAQSFVHDKPSIPPIHFLELCEQHQIEYESIGLQFYMGMKKEFTCREIMDISQTVDAFEAFNKIIHFSELGWPSKHDVDPLCFFAADHPEVAGRWHRGWDEELQAEFVEKIYTLFASKPKAASITWWDITDQGPHEDIGSRFIPFAGLTRRDYSPKPALLKIAEIRKMLRR